VHKQYIMYQLLNSLAYMHSGELLHRDVKPSNLLVNTECQVKVGDFGLARSVAALEAEAAAAAGAFGAHAAAGPVLTDYVATRWYRAPEILLGSTRYTYGVDMWSAGCILAELLAGRPCFPGSSTLNQLDRILALTGRPSAAELACCGSPYAPMLLESLPPACGPPPPLAQRFPTAPPAALDLLSRLLRFSPADRLSAEEALRHPYVAAFRGGGSAVAEPRCRQPISIPIDDNLRCSTEEYREKLYCEVVRRKKELRRRQREREAAAAAAAEAAAAEAKAAEVAEAEAAAAAAAAAGPACAGPERAPEPLVTPQTPQAAPAEEVMMETTAMEGAARKGRSSGGGGGCLGGYAGSRRSQSGGGGLAYRANG